MRKGTKRRWLLVQRFLQAPSDKLKDFVGSAYIPGTQKSIRNLISAFSTGLYARSSDRDSITRNMLARSHRSCVRQTDQRKIEKDREDAKNDDEWSPLDYPSRILMNRPMHLNGLGKQPLDIYATISWTSYVTPLITTSRRFFLSITDFARCLLSLIRFDHINVWLKSNRSLSRILQL